MSAIQDQISMWIPLHLYENIHEEDIIHLKRMERKNDFNLLKGLEEVFYRQDGPVMNFELRLVVGNNCFLSGSVLSRKKKTILWISRLTKFVIVADAV